MPTQPARAVATIISAAAACALALLPSACRRKTPSVAKTESQARSQQAEIAAATVHEQTTAIPKPEGKSSVGIGRTLPLVNNDGVPPDASEVFWRVTPAGANLRIVTPEGEIIERQLHGSSTTTLEPDFYDVSITHPGYQPIHMRTALGGSATNMTFALNALPPPEATPTLAPPEQAAKQDGETGGGTDALLAIKTPAPRRDLRALTLENLENIYTAEFGEKETAKDEKDPPRTTDTILITVVSTATEDTALETATKHLHLSPTNIRLMHGTQINLPAQSSRQTQITLRIANYDVIAPTLIRGGVSTLPHSDLVFRASPHPARATLAGAPPAAEVWSRAPQSQLLIGNASSPITLAAFKEHNFEVRLPGYQPLPLKLRSDKPGGILPPVVVKLMPPPFTARPGQTCRIDLGRGADMNLVWVPGGRFVMQNPRSEDGFPDTAMASVERGFWMAHDAVTQRQWAALTGEQPDADGSAAKTMINWAQANHFAALLSRLLPNSQASLPSEAEWEWAARESATIGLQNMCGEVRQWCSDTYATYRGQPLPPLRRVLRGGSPLSPPEQRHPQARDAAMPTEAAEDIGFRIILRMKLPQT